MSIKEWILAVIGTIAVGAICYWIDARDQQILTTPEIQVHGHSSTN
jgi:hypothetical protein